MQARENPKLSRRSIPLRDNGEALDLSGLKGVQEGVVGLEGHAAIGIAVRTQHVGMR